jgi:hypothetical protein
MKKGLLGSTALVAATALTAGVAQAQAPTVSFSGFINFQMYLPDNSATFLGTTVIGTSQDDATMYFGVDDAELHVNVSATADNGLEYGAKIELEAVQGGTGNADEARIQLRGSWGTLQLGDEDGAEDTMNYGGENVMGATGGFDGDFGDAASFINIGAPTAPTMAGDTSDATKLTYYSPRFSGIQVGLSYTPSTGLSGDAFKVDSAFNNSYAIGANYDGTFGDVRVRVSGVYVLDEAKSLTTEDNGAYSIGTIVGFGPFQLGANWTDNGESGQVIGSGAETSYWDVAVGFETGPLYLSAGYFASEFSIPGATEEFTNLGVAVDYTIAPGLTAYAEYNMIEDDVVVGTSESNVLIAGVNLSF